MRGQSQLLRAPQPTIWPAVLGGSFAYTRASDWGLVWFAWVNSNTIAESDIENGLRVFDLTKSSTSSIGAGAAKGRYFFHPALCGSSMLVASGYGPDGKTSSIYRVPLDGSGSIQLTEGPTDFFPECTADGKWLFYADNRDEHDPKLKRQPLQGRVAANDCRIDQRMVRPIFRRQTSGHSEEGRNA